MSIINIALQSVGLMRSRMPEELEKKLSGRNSVKQIREACESCPELKDAVIDSMQPVKALLESLFVRLKLKQQPFDVFHAASSAEIESLWSHILRIDGQLSREDSSAKILPHRPGLKKFLEHCCQERLYSFSIKKCGSTACSICAPPRLPAEVFETLHYLPDPVPDVTGEHYKQFDTVYGTCTTERYCPSLVEKSKKSHGMPFQPNAQFARCVCETLQCSECLKPRVLYSQRKLKMQEVQYLKNQLAGMMYSCGTILSELFGQNISPEQTNIVSRVFVRANLACTDPVETAYYSSGVFDDVCINCGDPNDIVQGEEAADILPTCQSCFNDQRKPKVLKRKRNQMPHQASKKPQK